MLQDKQYSLENVCWLKRQLFQSLHSHERSRWAARGLNTRWTSFSPSISNDSRCYLVSETAGYSCEEQSLVFVQTAVFSRLVKVVLSALKLSAAGWCTMQLRSLLHNSLRFISSTKLLQVVVVVVVVVRRRECNTSYVRKRNFTVEAKKHFG